jgi:hypothetical protein
MGGSAGLHKKTRGSKRGTVFNAVNGPIQGKPSGTEGADRYLAVVTL